LVDADARFAALRHRPRQLDSQELRVVRGAPAHGPRGFGRFPVHHIPLERFAGGAVHDTLLGRCRSLADGVEKVRSALACGGDVVNDVERVGGWRQEFVDGKLVGRGGGKRQSQNHYRQSHEDLPSLSLFGGKQTAGSKKATLSPILVYTEADEIFA